MTLGRDQPSHDFTARTLMHYSFVRIKYSRNYLVCEQPHTGEFEGIRCFELLKTLKYFIVIY